MKEHSSLPHPVREPLVGEKGKGRTGEYSPELRPERPSVGVAGFARYSGKAYQRLLSVAV